VARVIDTQRSRFLLGGLVLLHIVVISRQVDGGGGISLLERGVFAVLSPLQILVARGVTGVERSWSQYFALRGVQQENEALRGKVESLEARLNAQERQAQDGVRLRELLDLRPILPLDTVVAEVTSRDGVPWFRSVTLDKGKSHGIALNAPVLSSSGVVGRVVALGPLASKVQLLLDRDCGVAVLLQRSRAPAVLKGQIGFADSGSVELVVKYLSSLASVAVGDVVETSGLDGIYPKGLMVGRIQKIGTPSGLFRENATVIPSARFDTLEEVLVVKGQRPKPVLAETVK
jgi:rod shape-determining protein MreC